MLKPQQTRSIKTLFPLHTPFLHGNGGHAFLLQVQTTPFFKKPPKVRVGFSSANNIKAVATPSATEKPHSVKVKAIVTVKQTVGGQSLLLELFSAQLDPRTGLEKTTVQKGGTEKVGERTYKAEFEVPVDFGEVGAILVENEHQEEMFLEDVVLYGFPNGPITISCYSWVQSKHDNKVNEPKRVFFTNKSYLPSQTPNGLERLRSEELNKLRGNGEGERQTGDRVYDYDVYNDIGDLDSNSFGCKLHPYPRRCRTGRPREKGGPFYVPRDEKFSEEKEKSFSSTTVSSTLSALAPYLEQDSDLTFPCFTAIDLLFNEGAQQGILTKPVSVLTETVVTPIFEIVKAYLPRLTTVTENVGKVVGKVTEAVPLLLFKTPDTLKRDRFFWFRDEEFARQTLAGLNPYSLQLVTEWPLKSTLDDPPESAITTEIIECEIKAFMTVQEAIEQKKLFMLDYHDLLLPYVEKVRELEGTTLYGSRTLFFLTPSGMLRPLAIELTRPPQWKRVYTPSLQSTECWLWRLAKAHVLAHDSCYHQLVSHWLRTHCCTEPYIIATHRQLSTMHPIYRLLNPHFRYTMDINARARLFLINAGGIIESSFSTGKYSMEISSVAYDKQWRFDQEALPKDLIKRGLAVEDPSAPHGLKLTIEDNPFANDGLVLWDTIKQWVTDYVNHYYPNPSLVDSDKELQAWWSEIRNKGHCDKKDEPWWPALETPENLIEIITTVVWVASGHHAAVNFGQYTYAGYFPNRPTIARIKMPDEKPTEESWKSFLENPEVVLLNTLPSPKIATKVMAILDVLSTHSQDEKYLGDIVEPSWKDDPVINAAFERFNGRLKEFEGIVDERNAKPDLNNRNGAGMVPYELLKPFSESGGTRKGVPYSISI